MNKDKLMQFLSEAIDNGAELHVYMGQYNSTKDYAPVGKYEALRFAAMFKDAVGGEITENTHEKVCETFNVDVDKFRSCFSHSPVEKVEV
jgi:hypothetical protein